MDEDFKRDYQIGESKCILKRFGTTKPANQQMRRHEKADQNFYITTNTVMNLAGSAKEIFESSEVDEKSQLLNLVLRNLKFDGKNLFIHTCEPFPAMLEKAPKEWGQLDSNQRKSKTERFTVSCNCRYAIPP